MARERVGSLPGSLSGLLPGAALARTGTVPAGLVASVVPLVLKNHEVFIVVRLMRKPLREFALAASTWVGGLRQNVL